LAVRQLKGYASWVQTVKIEHEESRKIAIAITGWIKTRRPLAVTSRSKSLLRQKAMEG